MVVHLRSKHIEKFNLEIEKAAKLKEESKVQTQMSQYPNYVTPEPNLMESYVKWTCETLQPFNTCEHPSFKEMLSSLSPNPRKLCREAARNFLIAKAATMKEKVKQILAGEHVAILTDHWTSGGKALVDWD